MKIKYSGASNGKKPVKAAKYNDSDYSVEYELFTNGKSLDSTYTTEDEAYAAAYKYFDNGKVKSDIEIRKCFSNDTPTSNEFVDSEWYDTVSYTDYCKSNGINCARIKKSVKASMDSDLRNAGLKYNEDFSEGPYAAFAENAMSKGYVVHKFENGGVYPDGAETDFRTAMKLAKKYNIQYEYEYNQEEDMYSLPQIKTHIKQDGEFYAVGDNGKKYKASYDSRRKVMYFAIPSDVEIIGYIPIDNIDSACSKKSVNSSRRAVMAGPGAGYTIKWNLESIKSINSFNVTNVSEPDQYGLITAEADCDVDITVEIVEAYSYYYGIDSPLS